MECNRIGNGIITSMYNVTTITLICGMQEGGEWCSRLPKSIKFCVQSYPVPLKITPGCSKLPHVPSYPILPYCIREKYLSVCIIYINYIQFLDFSYSKSAYRRDKIRIVLSVTSHGRDYSYFVLSVTRHGRDKNVTDGHPI